MKKPEAIDDTDIELAIGNGGRGGELQFQQLTVKDDRVEPKGGDDDEGDGAAKMQDDSFLSRRQMSGSNSTDNRRIIPKKDSGYRLGP